MVDRRPGPLGMMAKLSTRVRTRGVLEIASLALSRAGEEVRSEDRLIFFSRSTEGCDSAPTRDDLVFKQALPKDGTVYARAIGTDSSRTFARRLSNSTRCFLIIGGEGILHASWVTTEGAWTRELRRYFVPPQGDAYVYESFTAAAARGKGIYPYALMMICAQMAREAIENIWVGAEQENTSSRRAITKAGFGEAFSVTYRRRLGRLFVDEPVGPQAARGKASLLRTLLR